MTPEERQLLSSLIDRVRSTNVPEKDGEAEQLIGDLVSAKPDTPYILMQAVLMQDFALKNAESQLAAARNRTEELQRQLAAQTQAQPTKSGGFLSGLFGSGSGAPAAGSVPPVASTANPWGRPLSPAAPQPGYAPPPQPAAYATQPGYAGYAGPAPAAPAFQPSQGSSFLRGAAQTAMGVAGGALLVQGIESMFGGHHGFGGGWGGGWGGMPPQENIIEENVTNNYYDDAAAPQGGDTPSDYDSGLDQDPGITQADYDTGGDGDFGSSDDFGGGDDWT